MNWINSHKVVQHDDTAKPKRLSKNMCNFLNIWHIKERKKIFFPPASMKMNWTFNYLKVMRRINQSSERKKERKKEKKKKERKKAKIFFSIYFFFLSVYMKMNLSFIYLEVMTRISISSNFILILSNRLG